MSNPSPRQSRKPRQPCGLTPGVASASLPPPRWLTFDEVVERVIGRFQVTFDLARDRLERAFRHGELVLVNVITRRGVVIRTNVEIDWDISGVSWLPDRPGQAGVSHVDLRVNAAALERWMRGGSKGANGRHANDTMRSPTETTRRPGVPKEAGEPPAPRVRGRKPTKRLEVERLMTADVAEGRCTPAKLSTVLEKDLAHRYGASRTLVRNVRNSVLSKLGAK